MRSLRPHRFRLVGRGLNEVARRGGEPHRCDHFINTRAIPQAGSPHRRTVLFAGAARTPLLVLLVPGESTTIGA
jgi:hypothetical protein